MSSIWARHALTDEGWRDDVHLTVDDAGEIAAVEAGQPVARFPESHKVGILLPAPVNVHSHAFQRAMAGLTEGRGPDPSDSFWTWRQLMFRFLDQLTPDHVEAITAYVQMEMLEAGYATHVEFHYLHHGQGGRSYTCLSEMCARIAAAADVSGIGLTLLPVFYQYGGCDGRPLGAGQVRFGNDLDRFTKLFEQAKSVLTHLPDDTRIGVAPHSLRAIPKDSLASLATLAEGKHMHLAEQAAEVEEVQAAWGQRPVEWLLDHADIDERWCLIHCTQMLPHETTAGSARLPRAISATAFSTGCAGWVRVAALRSGPTAISASRLPKR